MIRLTEANGKSDNTSRRTFLKFGAAGTAVFGLSLWRLDPLATTDTLSVGITSAFDTIPPVYNDWRDIYINKWKWDKVVKSTHFVNCWMQAHCSWNVYVKDGLVWREEQVAQYQQTRSELPDFNPRGCQKGACYSERMYDTSRLRYPLKRIGGRGEGKWERVSWDDALNHIADKMIDILTEQGGDPIIWDLGPGFSSGVQTAGAVSLLTYLDAVALDPNTEIGDGMRGAAETFGKFGFACSADDWMYSDLILIWASNPNSTQIPNAHFLTEARYNGTKIVTIAPDYNSSCIHADFHVQVNPGTDAALSLSICHEIIRHKRVDEDFIKEQTDLPVLVREDNQRFLRESDMELGGSTRRFYCYDQTRGLSLIPQDTLALGDIDPSLSGQYEVNLLNGDKVWVRPVYDLLRAEIDKYSPEQAEKICGTPAAMIRALAKLIGDSSSVAMLAATNIEKYYHGNLIQRAQILIFALTGNFGKKGSGPSMFAFIELDGLEAFTATVFRASDVLNDKTFRHVGTAIGKTMMNDFINNETDEIKVNNLFRTIFDVGPVTSGALFWYIHGGLLEGSKDLQTWDPYAKRSSESYINEMFDKGWQSIRPARDVDPKIMFHLVSNPIRRLRNSPRVIDHLYPKLDLDITFDWRMSSTAMYSDYVLPVAAWYEQTEVKWVTQLSPFLTSGVAATKPYFESKSDWEIHSRLAEAITRRAKERGIEAFKTRFGGTRLFSNVYDRFSRGGEYGHTDEAKVAKEIVRLTSGMDTPWEELSEKGFARFDSLGHGLCAGQTATTIKSDETITPLTKHIFEKDPYPTATRRQQFYLDHPLYIEMQETVPMHKDSPSVGGDLPFILVGAHTRWSIHSAWRDDKLMLRQQRGEPIVYMNVDDAKNYNIVDTDIIELRNDLGAVEIRVKVSHGIRPGQITYFHAWEKHQYRNAISLQDLMPAPINPVHCAGGEHHLTPTTAMLQPSFTDRDTRVSVSKV